jgi:hypothetical protein
MEEIHKVDEFNCDTPSSKTLENIFAMIRLHDSSATSAEDGGNTQNK